MNLSRKDTPLDTQYAKNLRPVGLLHTKMQIAAAVQQKDMYTRTGHRAWVWSVQVAQTRVDTIAKAVMPDG